MARPAGGQIGRVLLRAAAAGAKAAVRSLLGGESTRTTPSPREHVPAPTRARSTRHNGYPGDYTGLPTIEYRPESDGDPDPGEVVWSWVPYEEDHTRGKDRPVLVIGRDGAWLLGLMLTSKDHDRDAADEARHGRYWLDVGTGAWDAQRRPSEVRLDRVLRLAPDAVRREGAALDRRTFDAVVAQVRALRRPDR